MDSIWKEGPTPFTPPPPRYSFVTAFRAGPLPARRGEGRPRDFFHTCWGYFPQPGAGGAGIGFLPPHWLRRGGGGGAHGTPGYVVLGVGAERRRRMRREGKGGGGGGPFCAAGAGWRGPAGRAGGAGPRGRSSQVHRAGVSPVVGQAGRRCVKTRKIMFVPLVSRGARAARWLWEQAPVGVRGGRRCRPLHLTGLGRQLGKPKLVVAAAWSKKWICENWQHGKAC